MSRGTQSPIAVRWLCAILWLAAGLSSMVAAPAVAQRPVAQRPAPRFLAFETVLQGSGEAELRWPLSVGTGPSLELAVADAYGARLVFFSATGGGWVAAGVTRLPATPVAVVYDGAAT